jgi:DNA modification methylase
VNNLKMEIWPIDKLQPYGRNPRKNDKAVDKMVAAINEYGFRIPIVARSNGEVVDGHLRLKAAVVLKMTEVPVVLADDLTEAQVKAFRLLANRSVNWAEWDNDLLTLELQELKLEQFDLKLTGFTDNELIKLLRLPEAEDDNFQPPQDEAAPEPITQPGDVWLLGGHRLMCGDSTVATDVARLLGPAKPRLCVTDPPYGVNYKPDWREKRLDRRNVITGTINNDDRSDWSEVWSLFPGDVIYSWAPSKYLVEHGQALINCGFVIRELIIWDKGHIIISRGNYHHQFEPCWYAVRKGQNAQWSGGPDQSNLWKIKANTINDSGHSAQKPIECMKRPIENNSQEGDYVYEPFSGSGTTILACEITNRVCLAMEINPAYVDMAVQRWEKKTGERAVLEEKV